MFDSWLLHTYTHVYTHLCMSVYTYVYAHVRCYSSVMFLFPLCLLCILPRRHVRRRRHVRCIPTGTFSGYQGWRRRCLWLGRREMISYRWPSAFPTQGFDLRQASVEAAG